MWVGLMQFVSAIFLGLALYKIRRFHGSQSSPNAVNMRIIILHGVALILYLLSNIVYYAFYVVFYTRW